jgi:exonuclease III
VDSKSLTVVTWNLNLLEISQQAPQGWKVEHTFLDLNNLILQIKPEILALQEVPNILVADLIAKDLQMTMIQPVETHSGVTTLLIDEEVLKIKEVHILQAGVKAIIEWGDKLIQIISTHLPPFKNNAPQRFQILQSYLNNIATDPLLILGDMNMRDNETAGTLQLGLKDSFIEIGEPKSEKFSWDSRKNPFRRNDFGFVCRFDRILTKGFRTKSFNLIGNKDISGSKHYLSDHFGLKAELTLD